MSKLDEILQDWDTPIPENKLPSALQIGDKCRIDCIGFKVDNGAVVRVHFTASKVMYDLEVEFLYNWLENSNPTIGHTRIYNIDSAFLTRIEKIDLENCK